MDTLLVKRAQKQDTDAFIHLIEKHKMNLYKVAKSYLKSEDDVADAMQDTILSAYEHIHELKQASYFKTWITRILINRCNDLLRQQKRCLLSEQIDQVSQMIPERNLEFYELIAELPEDYRILFLLYYGEEFRISEIAQILDINENTVKSKLRRGREKLKSILCY